MEIRTFLEKPLLLNLVTKKVKEIPGPEGGSSVAYSPDDKFLAVAGDETLSLLDTATNSVLRTLPGHYNNRGCIVFSPDSRYLASVSDGWGGIANRSIRVFEVASGTEIHSFKKELPIFAAAFSPDGAKLAVGGADATAVILDLQNLTGKKRRKHLTEKELANHWESLTATDASKAYEARIDLLHAPKSAVPFLAKRLQPASAIDAKRVQGLIKDLDSDSFQTREDAARELDRLGELVREPMRKALAAHPSLEMRQRLQALLGKLAHLTPTQLRDVRAVEILEDIGTPEAVRILERLTKGNPDGLLTVESRAVIARLKKKSAPLPPSPIAQKEPAPERPVLPAGPVLPDRYGDPMPAGAIARLGNTRWSLVNEPLRIIVSAKGKRLAVVNSYAGIEILDSQTGRSFERVGTGFFNWGIDLRMAVALSADWRKIAAVEEGGTSRSVLAVFDRDHSKKVKIEYRRKKESYPVVPEEVEEAGSSFSSTTEYLSETAFSPDGKRLIGSVRFEWECGGGNVFKKLKESHLIAWDAATGKKLWKTLVPEKIINTISFSPDGKTLTVVDQAGVGFWDAPTGRVLRRWQSKDSLFSARYSPNRKWLAAGSKEKVLLWEVATGKLLRRLTLPGKEIKAIAFSRDGKLLAGGGEKTIRFWDPLTGKSRGDCSAFPNSVQAVAFLPDGKNLSMVWTGHIGANRFEIWDVASGRKLPHFEKRRQQLHGWINGVCFSADGKTVLLRVENRDEVAIRAFDRFNAKEVGKLPEHKNETPNTFRGGPQTLFPSPDGRLLATREWGSLVLIWNMARLTAPSASRGSCRPRSYRICGPISAKPIWARCITP